MKSVIAIVRRMKRRKDPKKLPGTPEQRMEIERVHELRKRMSLDLHIRSIGLSSAMKDADSIQEFRLIQTYINDQFMPLAERAEALEEEHERLRLQAEDNENTPPDSSPAN